MNPNNTRLPGHRFAGALSLIAMLSLGSQAQAQTSSITRVSSFVYGSTPATQGLLVQEIVEPDRPQDCLSTSYEYDDYGNKSRAITAACAGASYPATASAGTARTAATVFAAQTVAIGGVSYSTPAGAFATQSTNAIGQSESKEYDPRFGSVTKLVGPNGGITTWAYDGFGRKSEERRADGTYTLWEYKFCGQAQNDGAAPPCAAGGSIGSHQTVWYVSEASYSSSNVLLAPKKLQIHDTLDRVVRIQTQDFHGQTVGQDTYFNYLGQVSQKSNLYRLSGGTPLWTQYTYDRMGRVLTEDTPDGSQRAVTSFAYNGLVTTVTNASSQTKTTYKNAAGQTARVVDHLGNAVVYSYDAIGQLTQTDAAGSITKMGYNQRGQKLWMEDPAMGRWDYAYNAFGELVSQTDSLGQSSAMVYDPLGRLTQRSEPDLVSTWSYDKKFDGSGCGAGIGKLCEARTTNGYQRVHSYDAMGRPDTTATKLDNSTTLATMSQSYEAGTGRVLSKTWPTGYVASYAYTASGYLSKVTGGGVAGHTQTVTFEVLAMNPQGEITQYRQGNNVTTVKTIDEGTGKLYSVQATLAGQAAGNVLSHSYSYDSLGNLKTRSDAVTGVSESFQYDALNRLSLYTALGGGLPGTQAIQTLYDAAGNLKYKSDVGYYNYDAARPNRLTNITLAGGGGWSAIGAVTQPNTGTRALSYAFDDYRPGAKTLNGVTVGNGNLWYTVSQDNTTGRHTVRWENYTSFNMPREILFGSLTNTANPTSTVADRTLSFVYGPEHQRVRQDVQLSANAPSTMEAGTTWYWNGTDSQGLSYEKEIKANGTIEHKHYVNAGGVTFALYVKREGALNGKPATSISYFHQDHLGSIAVVSNEAGQVVERMAYDPWGKRRYANGTADRLDAIYGVNTDRGYTMHEHLDEMGMIHMNGRIFDPLVGRFMSADPHIQYPGNLQSYNRYSYVLNNPLAFTDPSGYFSLRSLVRAVAAIAVAYYTGQWALLNGYSVTAAKVMAGAAGGFAGGVVSGGTLKSGVQGAFTGALFGAAGTVGAADSGARYLAHAGAGCISAVAGGGNCGQGAASAAFGKFATNNIDIKNEVGRGVATAIAGGIGSVIAGGKFANGAETATYAYLFNALSGRDLARMTVRGLAYLSREVAEYGYGLVAPEVSFEGASGVKVRIDGVYIGPDGRVLFGEAKVGDYADLTKNQKVGLPELQDGKGTFYGAHADSVAKALGIQPDAAGRFSIDASRIQGVYIGTYDRSTSQTGRMQNINEVVRGRGFWPRSGQD
jgi:RHS repeat-associated protein